MRLFLLWIVLPAAFLAAAACQGEGTSPTSTVPASALGPTTRAAGHGPPSTRTASAPTLDPIRLSTGEVYASDRLHIWNLLFRQFYVRTSADGTSYGSDVLDPLLWLQTVHLLEPPVYDETIALLDEFLSTDGDTLITDPLKRAMLQRDLWAVFDWAALRRQHLPDQRQELQVRLAQLMRRLALTREQIRSLPDNYSEAVASGRFSASYLNPSQAFLPEDLFSPDSGWLNLGREGGPVAMNHVQHLAFSGRSAFLVFVRMPEQTSEATLDMLTRGQAPPGTQVALVRRALLLDEGGHMVLSPLTESVQIRHFYREDAQAFFKFRLSRASLFAADAGGLRPLGPDEKEFDSFGSHGFDPFESFVESGAEEAKPPSLQNCATCHFGTGTESILSYSRRQFPVPDRQQPIVKQTTPELEAEVVVNWKRGQRNREALQALWSR